MLRNYKKPEIDSGLKDTIITIDPHKEHLLDFFSVPTQSCSALSEIAQHLRSQDIDFILAPDKGAKPKADIVASIIGCDSDSMEKTRVDASTVKVKPKTLDVKGKNVAIIDDIISTGGTMATSVKQLKQQGAKHVSVACTHGLFIGNAVTKLKKAGTKNIIATDTIQSKYGIIKVGPVIAQALQTQ